MKINYWLSIGALCVLAACAHQSTSSVDLIRDGKGLDNFSQVGDANWRVENNLIVADRGKAGFLLTKESYKDVYIRAEFWAETDTNSGIFIRITDPAKIAAASSYEINIWDIRPEPKYGTGAIVDVAPVKTPITNLAGGKWNVMEIRAVGPEIVVILNGVETTRANDTKFKEGPIALQFGPGVKGAAGGPIRWRSVQVQKL
jgi:Domain of Unknown Function (DUF1080)